MFLDADRLGVARSRVTSVLRRGTRPAILLAVASVLLAACASGSAVESAAGPGTARLSADVRAELSALRQNVDDVSVEEYDLLVEEAIASCIRTEGFEYIAVSDRGGSKTSTADTLSDAAYLEQFGFGMLTSIESQAHQAAPQDPNQAMYDSLSEGDRVAFDDARDLCTEQGFREVGPPPGVVQVSNETASELDAAYARARSSAAVVEAQRTWATCMSEAGFSFDDRDDMLEQLGQNAERFAGPFIDGLNALYAASDNEAAAALTMIDVLSATEHDDYLAAFDFEVAVAQRDSSCAAPVEASFDAAYNRELDALINS